MVLLPTFGPHALGSVRGVGEYREKIGARSQIADDVARHGGLGNVDRLRQCARVRAVVNMKAGQVGEGRYRWCFLVGATQVRVADPVETAVGAVTSMVNGPIDAVVPPSLAVMVMAPVVPTSAVVGVPVKLPGGGLNVAQDRCPVIEKVTVPLLSLAMGWKE